MMTTRQGLHQRKRLLGGGAKHIVLDVVHHRLVNERRAANVVIDGRGDINLVRLRFHVGGKVVLRVGRRRLVFHLGGVLALEAARGRVRGVRHAHVRSVEVGELRGQLRGGRFVLRSGAKILNHVQHEREESDARHEEEEHEGV